jgi:hypothetical protein
MTQHSIEDEQQLVHAGGQGHLLGLAGLYALSYANSRNVHASTWWLDVETSNTWNNDVAQNQNSLAGRTRRACG